jgi:nitric oxide reductase large subunit
MPHNTTAYQDRYYTKKAPHDACVHISSTVAHALWHMAVMVLVLVAITMATMTAHSSVCCPHPG